MYEMDSFHAMILCLSATIVLNASDCCPDGWSHFRGSCYRHSAWETSWPEAAAICVSAGAKLAEIETSEENTFLKDFVKKHGKGKDVWVGGSDVFEEGKWVWMSTQRAIHSYQDWNPNEPNNSGNGEEEHCLELRNVVNYKWNDRHCNTNHTFFCETRATF